MVKQMYCVIDRGRLYFPRASGEENRLVFVNGAYLGDGMLL